MTKKKCARRRRLPRKSEFEAVTNCHQFVEWCYKRVRKVEVLDYLAIKGV